MYATAGTFVVRNSKPPFFSVFMHFASVLISRSMSIRLLASVFDMSLMQRGRSYDIAEIRFLVFIGITYIFLTSMSFRVILNYMLINGTRSASFDL